MASYDPHLNPLGIGGDFPPFTAFRRERAEGEKADQDAGVFACDLPESLDNFDNRKSYLIYPPGLGIPSQAIVVLGGTAKEFLGRNDLASEISKHMPEDAKAEF